VFFRLLLLGGCSGFLKNMKNNNIKPDIKVFTQLLEVIPSTLIAEKVSYLYMIFLKSRIYLKFLLHKLMKISNFNKNIKF